MPIRDPEKLKEYNRAYYQKNKVSLLQNAIGYLHDNNSSNS